MENKETSPPLGGSSTGAVAPTGRTALRLFGYTAKYIGDDIHRDLEDIASRASRNNARDGVTGALLFDAGRFIQVVEGPEASVTALYDRIQRDQRIRALRPLFDTGVDHRSMDDWALWVGRTDLVSPIPSEELERFRAMYERGFRLDAFGFVTLLKTLIQSISG